MRFSAVRASTRRTRFASGLLAAGLLGACAEAPATVDATEERPSLSAAALSGGRSIIIGANGVLPADLEAQVTKAGGTLEGTIPEIGVAFVSNVRATATFTGVQSVASDLMLTYNQGRSMEMTAEPTSDLATAQVASLADNEPFYRFQYAPGAVQAPEVWNTGVTGRGVRVAVLDGGLFNTHPDLAAGVDIAASRSFITGAYNTDIGNFWHGTHVAGIIGARDNGVGLIGIAPNATLIGVKVLHNGSGPFSSILNGVVYAAKPISEGGAGAQVINMSLGAYIENGKEKELKPILRDLETAIDRAMRYANQQGTTVIVAAGNDAVNMDVNKFDVVIPAMSARAIGVSSTAPIGWAYGNTDFSRQSSYTTFGKAVVNLAAPGGDFAYAGAENCNFLGLVRPCWVFDMYLSTSRAGYSWAAGTSMAAPVTAGIAALIIEKNGGRMDPAQVRAKLQQGAIDLGKPGFDAVYGQGFVNAMGSMR